MLTRPTIALTAGLSLFLSACGSKATGQAVAVVNGEEITIGELNSELETANIPASADKKKVMPQLLQQIIDRRLMAQRASEQGIDKSPDFLNQERRLRESLLLSLASKRQADSIRIPDQRAIDAFIAANPSMFRDRSILLLDQLQFQPPVEEAQVARLRNDHSIGALAASLTALGVPFVRTEAKLDTATVPSAVMKQIEALPAGEPFIVPISGRMYASVIKGRQPANSTVEENRKIAADAIRRQTLQTSFGSQLKQLRNEAKIEYQDGYAPTKAAKVAAVPAAR
ncbi:MAG: hypothetical protein AVDCRST_MAG91-383 [uncultured Sphingomonadaceae bacterium]|uniref:peptidylprolyl isomerase n=1 Tax=uncultured Sphingomonadaceae bacterium TaxID=169976 RepID=A0A6J4S282_9SPHN|nr:MAG: hypothetical protein AVDCRST_MAG91-383 [uncultured Sphingomonadaceae bacterium]